MGVDRVYMMRKDPRAEGTMAGQIITRDAYCDECDKVVDFTSINGAVETDEHGHEVAYDPFEEGA